MKKKVFLLCLLTVFGATATQAAEVGYRLNNQNNEVVIEGSLDSGKERVSLQIYNRKAFDTYIVDGNVNAENIDKVLVYSAQGYTKEDGSFCFSFPLEEASDSYLARVGAPSMEKAIDYGFYYTDPTEEAELIVKLKKITGAQSLMEFVEGENPDDILIYNPDTAYAQVKNKLAIFQKLVQEKDYTNLTEFSTLFTAYTRLQEINEITDTELLEEKLLGYDKLTQLSGQPFYEKTYTEVLTDTQKDEVLESVIAHKDFESFEEIGAYMGEQVLLSAIENNGWAMVQQVIEDNEDMFEARTINTYFSTTAKKEKVAKAIAGKGYASLSAVEKAFADAFEKKKENQNGGGGGGGGSSSSVIVGGGVQIPVVEPIVTIAEQKLPFADLDGFDWAKPSIEALWKKAVVSGVSEDAFMPEKAVTREEFVAMVVRNFGFMNEKAECDFSDVSKEEWCYRAIASAYKAGIVFGTEENAFGKGEKITRQDMCVIAYRAAEKAGIVFEKTEELPFSDEISEYAKEQISVLYANGIVSGFDAVSFGAMEDSNRAQAAVVLHRMNEYKGKEE